MIPVLHLGLGDIGKLTLRAILAQSSLYQLVGAIDVNPALAGKNLRSIMPDAPNLTIYPTIKEAIKNARQRPQVATVTTTSQTARVKETIEELIDAKIHSVASCE